jgi:hypothetical protein
MDGMFVLKKLVSIYIRKNKELHVMFTDFRKVNNLELRLK